MLLHVWNGCRVVGPERTGRTFELLRGYSVCLNLMVLLISIQCSISSYVILPACVILLSKYTMYRLDDAGSTARAFVLLSECVKIDDVSGGIDDAA